MLRKNKMKAGAAFACLAVAAAHAQEPEMSARELFRKAALRLMPSAAGRPSPSSGTGSRPSRLPVPTVPTNRPAPGTAETAEVKRPNTRAESEDVRPSTLPATPPQVKRPRPEVDVAETAPPAQPSGGPGQPEQVDRPARAETELAASQARPDRDEVQMIPASLDPDTEPLPLGLRYSLLKQVQGNTTVEVGTDSVFHSGERIRLSVESSGPAYLYVVLQGSSGQWSVLFPSEEISGGNNYIQPGHRYSIPARHWFAFDEQVGEEKLFLLLSRQPHSDLEKLIYEVQETPTGEPSKPSTQPEKVLLAANIPPLQDAFIGSLREEVYARDLVFEKVDDSSPGDAEKAVYVVNTATGDDSQVVADLVLTHR